MANLGQFIKGGIETTKAFCKANAAEIVIGSGIVSMASANIATVLVQPKIQEAREKYKGSKKDIAMHVLPWYIPTVVLTGAGAGMIIAGVKSKNKKLAALGASVAISAEAIKSYQSEIRELVDEAKANDIEEKIAKKQEETIKSEPKLAAAAPSEREDGLYLCMEGLTGQVFWANEDRIKRVYEWLNRQVYETMYCSVNDYLCEFELHETSDGYNRGWTTVEPGYVNRVGYISKYVCCDTAPYAGRPVLRFDPTVDPVQF